MQMNTRRSVMQNVIMILLGAVLAVWPHSSLEFLVTMIGWGLIISGITGMFSLISALVPSVMAYCVIELLLGIFFLRSPRTFASFIPVLIGIAIIVNGCIKIYYAYLGKNAVGYNPLRDIVFAVIMIVFGVLVVAHPFGTASVVTRLIGVVLIYNGIVNLITPERNTFA